MRLLYVIDSLVPGGAETSLAEMAPGLVSRGIDLHIAPLSPRLDLAPRLEAAGAIVHDPPKKTGRIQNVRHLLELGKNLQPSLIHTTLYESDIAGRTAGLLLRIPNSTSVVSDSYGPSHYREHPSLKLHVARTLDAATSSFARRFHATSEVIASNISRRLGIPSKKIDVIPRGRDPQVFRMRTPDIRAEAREQLGISPDIPAVLAVGRLEPAKGLHHLLSAVPVIAQSMPTAVLLIAGRDGRSSHLLRNQADQLPLKIRFLGHRTDIPALLAAADVLAFPSEREGSPGTLIEAMAVGTPIVASNIAPCLEILGGPNPATGTITPVGDVTALGEAITSILTDSSAVNTQISQARTRFESHYTVEAISTRMANFFFRQRNNTSPSADSSKTA